MPSHPASSSPANASRLGWARRVLRQQLDALSRLAVIAGRLIDPAPLPADSATTLFAGIRNLEKALRLHARLVWAQRLIDALRAKLLADLEAVDNGQALTPPEETSSADAEPERLSGKADSAERPERPERPERERFGFERRGSDKALAEILNRPTVEIIALICRELGLPEDWLRLAEEDWARETTDQDFGLATQRVGAPPLAKPASKHRRTFVTASLRPSIFASPLAAWEGAGVSA